MRPADACPDANELGAFADGRLSLTARRALLTHLLACDTCREVVVVVSAFTWSRERDACRCVEGWTTSDARN